MSIYSYDKTASNNNDIQGITITDGVMRTNSVDNAFQALTSDIARLRDDQSSQIISTGAANEYVIVSNSTITAYAAGQRFHFKAHQANAAAAVANVDGVGQRAIEKRGSLALSQNDITLDKHCIIEYDAARDVFELLNPNGAETIHTHTLADITDSGALAAKNTVATADIDNDSVTFDKLAGGTADTLRGHDGSGNPAEVSVGAGLSLTGGVLSSAAGGVLLHVQHQEAGNGGTATAGSWQTRPINAEVLNAITGASLAANQIVLPAGTYKVLGYSIYSETSDTHTRLRNITDSATVLMGGTISKGSSGVAAIPSPVQGSFTIAAQKTFELQYYCEAGAASSGLGRSVAASGETNVYADLLIEKIA